jgi:hypothetical protein
MSERELFLASLQIADPQERSTWLDRACGGDADAARPRSHYSCRRRELFKGFA